MKTKMMKVQTMTTKLPRKIIVHDNSAVRLKGCLFMSCLDVESKRLGRLNVEMGKVFERRKTNF